MSNSANGSNSAPGPAMIELAEGKYVDLLNPQPEMIELENIARGLANTCRFGGHIRRFYSVAEHSVLVSDLLKSMGASRQLWLAGLFHDAAEAFLGDLCSPLKWAMRQTMKSAVLSSYDVLTERMDAAIAERFGLEPLSVGEREQLELADLWALRIETYELVFSRGENWRWPELPNEGKLPNDVGWYGGDVPDDARALWLEAVAQTGEGLLK